MTGNLKALALPKAHTKASNGVRADGVALIAWILVSVFVCAAMMPSRHGFNGRVVGALIGYAVGCYPLLIVFLWRVDRGFALRLIAFSLVAVGFSGWLVVTFPAPWF